MSEMLMEVIQKPRLAVSITSSRYPKLYAKKEKKKVIHKMLNCSFTLGAY